MSQQYVEAPPQLPALPESVREAYGISEDVEVEKLSGGLVNDTLLVRDQGEHTIMRRLAPFLSDSLLDDAQAVGGHLVAHGWEAPQSLPTKTGRIHTRDASQNLWHRMRFIPSDGKAPDLSTELAADAGTMIGNWHATARQSDYRPKYSIPNFHNTDYYASELQTYMPALEHDKPVSSLAKQIFESYKRQPAPAPEPAQLIHGDPKIDNILFLDGKPFTLIDFDTIMHGSPWIDVGDFLRSLTGKLLQQAEAVSSKFVAAYHEASELKTSLDYAAHRAQQATGQIALELGMRYLNDIVDGKKYFSWDPTKFESRRDNHLARAELQMQVARLALETA